MQWSILASNLFDRDTGGADGGAGFLTVFIPGEPSGHSCWVRTFFGQMSDHDMKMVR